MSETESWRPRYRAKVNALIGTYIESVPSARVKLSASARAAVDELGGKAVGAVTRSDVLRVADAIKPGAADQLMAQLSAFYNWSFDRGVEIPNPARNRLRVTGGRRLRHRSLNDAEFLTLWRAVEKEGDPAAGAFMLLALTGARRREVTQMRWIEVDLEAATWTLPPERRKTGKRDPEPFVIHLHSSAVAILKKQPVLEGSPFVFWGRRDRRPFDFHNALMVRLKQLPVADWRLHDLRRYMRSGLSRLGVQQVVAEMCLGHVAKSGLVAVYDRHSYGAEKRDAWLRWGDYIASLVSGT
jgi:integrase